MPPSRTDCTRFSSFDSSPSQRSETSATTRPGGAIISLPPHVPSRPAALSPTMDDYETRKLARYEQDGLLVSTARTTDTEAGRETAIRHPDYNNGQHIVVEEYDDDESALKGHARWVQRMMTEPLPTQLRDVLASELGLQSTFKRRSTR